MKLFIATSLALSLVGCIQGPKAKNKSPNTSGQSSLPNAQPSPTPVPSSTGQASTDTSTADDSIAQATPTKFPILLHHGLLTSDDFGSFKGLVSHLEDRGYVVYHSEVSAINAVSYRARQLGDQIDAILEETNATKVNIIAHSMGGLDARYVISAYEYGDRVATLSTIGTPHRGTALADYAQNYDDESIDTLELLLSFLAQGYNDAEDTEDAEEDEVIDDLTTGYMTNFFNTSILDHEDVYYQSWAGYSGFFTDDTIKQIMWGTWTYLLVAEGRNDGLVSIESAKWGEYRGEINADHIDMIGYKLGDTKKAPFNHLNFYTDLVEELVEMGY